MNTWAYRPKGHSFSDGNVRYGLLSPALQTHSFHIKFLAALQTMTVCTGPGRLFKGFGRYSFRIHCFLYDQY